MHAACNAKIIYVFNLQVDISFILRLLLIYHTAAPTAPLVVTKVVLLLFHVFMHFLIGTSYVLAFNYHPIALTHS